MGSKLESLTNFAILVFCVVVTITLVMRWREPAPSLGPSADRSYAVGEKVAIDGVDFGASEWTLVLAVRRDCRYCAESMPFYARLLGRDRVPSRLRFVVVSPDPADVTRSEFTANGMNADEVIQVSGPSLKIAGTPTLILVDSAGAVRKVWLGRLTGDAEEEVLRAIG